ncbi:MAG: hypothetical protein PHI32_12075 [Dysgonamonadaceae bacterium]|nr:hypothetical protein [Dysgonamonadaceae bacterium]
MMKRLLTVFLLLLFAVSLSSCSVSNINSTTSANESTHSNPQSSVSVAADNSTTTTEVASKVTASSSVTQVADDLSSLLENKANDIIKNPKLPLISGYSLISVATGCLNADNRSDLALVVEHTPGDVLGTRTLYVLLQNSDGTYKVSLKNSNVISGNEEGGVWGDPFKDIVIKDGILNVDEYGGSNFRWQISN